MVTRPASLSLVIVLADGEMPARAIRALSEALPGLAEHGEIIAIANGIGAAAARELAALVAELPDMTAHFLADAAEPEVATLIGMERALGDWVVVMTPTEAEVAALPALLDGTAGHEVVFAGPPGAPPAGGAYGMAGRLFFRLAGRLAGAPLEWPTPRLRAYSRPAARWLTGRLDGAMLIRSLAFRGSFPGRRLELAGLDPGFDRASLGEALWRALRNLTSGSTMPLRLGILLACAGVFAGVLALLYVLVVFATRTDVQPGWTTLSGLIAVMLIIFSALFALLTTCTLAVYSSIQPRARVPVVRELRSPHSRMERRLDVAEAELGAPALLPAIRP